MSLRRRPALLVLLVTVSLTAGCSAELPPGARGPLWESVVKSEAQHARSGQVIGVGLFIVGAAFLVAGLLPDVEVLAAVGLGSVQLGVLQVPVGVFVMLIGLGVIYLTRYNIKVRDGKARHKRD